MTRPVNNVASGNVLIDALIKTRRFDPATAVGGSVTYRFAPSANHYQNIFNYVDGLAMPLDMTGYTTATDALVGTFQAATTSLQSTIVAAFGQFSSLTNLSFAAAAAGAAAN